MCVCVDLWKANCWDVRGPMERYGEKKGHSLDSERATERKYRRGCEDVETTGRPNCGVNKSLVSNRYQSCIYLFLILTWVFAIGGWWLFGSLLFIPFSLFFSWNVVYYFLTLLPRKSWMDPSGIIHQPRHRRPNPVTFDDGPSKDPNEILN